MASKGTSVVAERRLRPLWEAIDSRQYKTALKIASSLLGKHPDSVYLLVLKALVLERMGKGEEALVLCQQARESGPVDDLTLSTLQIVFQRLDCLEQATLCYEHACSKNPNNIELMMGLFNCYIREYSYLKQQQTAMKMHKLFGEERFLLWAVCSIQLQVWCANGDKSLLQLAEALLKKRLDTHGFEELEALLVYVTLLRHEGKFAAALDVLSSKSGGLFSILDDKLKLEGELLLLSHQYKRAAEVLQEVLETSADEWVVFLQYLDACLEKSFDGAVSVSYDKETRNLGSSIVVQASEASITSLPKEEAEERLQDASTFIQELQDKDHQELRRGPFLARLEIEKRRILLKLQGENAIQNTHCSAFGLTTSIVAYFKRFGHMVSFVSDIQDYLEFIQRHSCTNLVELLHDAFNKEEDETPVNLMRRKVSLHQVEMKLYLKAAASDKDVVAYAKEIAKLYVEGLKLSKDLDPQENLHGEELLTIAVTLLIELFCRSKHPGYVVEAILLLEFGLAVRRYSFPYKLMLINLYSTLFCVSAAFDWYKSLDAKNILVETLSHHILPSLIKSSTLWSELDTLFKDMIKFYDDYLKEAADLAILAYRHCNYSKVLEFVQFKEKIQHSHNLAVVKAESTVLRLKQKADNPEEVLKILENINYGREALDWVREENLKALSFNDALESRPWWSPAPGECFLTGTFEEPLKWQQKTSERQCLRRKEIWCVTLQRRCLLPRLINLSLGVVGLEKLGEDRKSPARTDMIELRHLVEDFGKHLGWSWEKLESLFTDLASSKLHLRDLNVEASDVFSLALFWTAYQIALQSCSVAISDNSLLQCPGFLNDLVKNFLAELTNSVQSSDVLEPKSYSTVVASWSAFPSLVSLTTEAFAWYSLFLQRWLKALQPIGKIGKKKKKGTLSVEQPDASANGNCPTLLDALNTCNHIFCSEVEGLISWLTILLEIPEAASVDAYLELLERGRQSEEALGVDIMPVPGLVVHVLESTSNESDDFGQRIGSVIQTWHPDLFIKNMLNCQRTTLSDLKDMSTLRLKTLQALKF